MGDRPDLARSGCPLGDVPGSSAPAFSFASTAVSILLADQGNWRVMAEPGALVVPAGAGLVAAPPCGPVLGVAGLPGWWWGEEACDLGDGQRDHPRIGGRRLVRPYRPWCLGIGVVAQ